MSLCQQKHKYIPCGWGGGLRWSSGISPKSGGLRSRVKTRSPHVPPEIHIGAKRESKGLCLCVDSLLSSYSGQVCRQRNVPVVMMQCMNPPDSVEVMDHPVRKIMSKQNTSGCFQREKVDVSSCDLLILWMCLIMFEINCFNSCFCFYECFHTSQSVRPSSIGD